MPSHTLKSSEGFTAISEEAASFTALVDGDVGCQLLSNTSFNADTSVGHLMMLFKIFIFSVSPAAQLFSCP